jgi:hypothetical protein
MFMRTWYGQDEWGFACELFRCCGGGLLVGLLLDFIFSRWDRADKAERRRQTLKETDERR